jgi:hypothetical protein
MATSINTAAELELRSRSGHFLMGEYSPAQRAPERSVVPARTSAHPEDVAHVRSRYTGALHGETPNDLTCVPTMPQPRSIWQYETVNYRAESSLSTFSLARTDTDAALSALPSASLMVVEAKQKKYGARQREHSIIERLRKHDVTDIDTVPPLISHAFGAGARDTFPLRPGDKLRWWLLQPGRLEFLLWFVGTIFLICVTVILLLLLLSSLGYLTISR